MIRTTTGKKTFHFLSKIALCASMIFTVGSALAVSSSQNHAENTKAQMPQKKPSADSVKSVPDVIIGNADAPITVIEYSSINCVACAQFHQKVFPIVKEKYIDTGKVRFIFRHFPLDEHAAKVTAILSKAPEVKQFTLIQRLFEQQERWINNANPEEILSEITGISLAECKKAFIDKALADAVLKKRLEAEKSITIDGTPTFVINGRIINHAPTLEKLEPYFDASPAKNK